MAANHREKRVFPGPIEYYIGMVRNIPAAGLKFTLSGETPIADGVLFLLKHGVSFTSWGESIKLALISQGNQTLADIDSECALPTQIVDWGKNQENVKRLLSYLAQGAACFQQSVPQSRQAVICPNCGKALDPASAFCSACGTRLR